MAQGFTLEQLKSMGAKPIAQPARRGFTLQELQKMGAKPVTSPITQPKPETSGVLSVPVGFTKGVLKGVGSTLFGVGQLGERAIRAVTGGERIFTEKPEFLKPKTTAEKIGFGLEQIGEFFVPAGAAAKLVKAGENIIMASKIGRVAAMAIKTEKGLTTAQKLNRAVAGISKLGVRAGVSAGTLAGVTAIQTGGEPEEIKSAAKFGAALPIVAPVVGKIVRKGLTAVGKRTLTGRLEEMTRNLRTLQSSFEEGTRYVVKDGKKVITSTPIKTLTERKLVPAIKDAKVDTTEVVKKLDDEIAGLSQPRKLGLKKSKITIPIGQFKNDVLETITQSKELKSSGLVTTTLKKAQSLIDDFRSSYGKKLSLQDIDDIRVTMNKRFDPELRDVFRAIGDASRRIVYKFDKGSREILRKESELISAKRFAEVLNGRPIKGGRLGAYVNSIIGTILGVGIGAGVGGPFGALAGALGAVGGREFHRIMRGFYFKAPGAKSAQRLLELGKKIKETPAGKVIFGESKSLPR